MRKYLDRYSVIAHLFLSALIILVLVPGAKKTQPISAMLAGLVVIEVLYILQCRRWHKRGESFRVPSCIVSIVWAVLIIWEILVTKLNCMHPVLYPAPENVFYVYRTQYATILLNILSSMELLAVSIFIGVVLGVVLGVTVGWIPVLSDVFYPIANVLAPIPSVVYAPYIIAIMPSFRSASAMVIVIGIFFPMFLDMVNRVKAIDPQIIDSALMQPHDDYRNPAAVRGAGRNHGNEGYAYDFIYAAHLRGDDGCNERPGILHRQLQFLRKLHQCNCLYYRGRTAGNGAEPIG